MRLWSLHPKYLDRQGLVAVWREGLLAQAVLQGKTKGYKNHPQLDRFKQHPDPIQAIAYYLHEVRQEALERNYNFDGSKINSKRKVRCIEVTTGQMVYEVKHLKNKLAKRSPQDFQQIKSLKKFSPHPIFQVVEGEIEDWEKITS